MVYRCCKVDLMYLFYDLRHQILGFNEMNRSQLCKTMWNDQCHPWVHARSDHTKVITLKMACLWRRTRWLRILLDKTNIIHLCHTMWNGQSRKHVRKWAHSRVACVKNDTIYGGREIMIRFMCVISNTNRWNEVSRAYCKDLVREGKKWERNVWCQEPLQTIIVSVLTLYGRTALILQCKRAPHALS